MKNRYLLFMLLICTGLMLSTAHAQQQSRIINGKPASTATYPWMASIFILGGKDSDNGGGCGGSLIAPNWVLTAAHCFLNEAGDAIADDPASLTTVTLNTDNIVDVESGAIERSASRVLIHPSYRPDPETSANTNDYDIALVELTSSVSATPVKLFTGALPAHFPTIAAGWGATVGDGSAPSDTLLQTQLRVSTADICDAAHEGLITGNMFCAGSYSDTDTSDTCQGDSGGPLFVNLAQGAMQIGITSFGGSETANCGTPGSPGVYASIATLFGFINDNVTGMTAVNSLADVKSMGNAFDESTGLVNIPKVYVGTQNYTVTLKLLEGAGLNFFLASADENATDDPNAVPSFYDGVLILPQVKVGLETFNVKLRHLGNPEDFRFTVESADSI